MIGSCGCLYSFFVIMFELSIMILINCGCLSDSQYIIIKRSISKEFDFMREVVNNPYRNESGIQDIRHLWILTV